MFEELDLWIGEGLRLLTITSSTYCTIKCQGTTSCDLCQPNTDTCTNTVSCAVTSCYSEDVCTTTTV